MTKIDKIHVLSPNTEMIRCVKGANATVRGSPPVIYDCVAAIIRTITILLSSERKGGATLENASREPRDASHSMFINPHLINRAGCARLQLSLGARSMGGAQGRKPGLIELRNGDTCCDEVLDPTTYIGPGPYPGLPCCARAHSRHSTSQTVLPTACHFPLRFHRCICLTRE